MTCCFKFQTATTINDLESAYLSECPVLSNRFRESQWKWFGIKLPDDDHINVSLVVGVCEIQCQ